MIEEWRPVPSFEGVMASSLGRIVLPPRSAKMPHGGVRMYNPKPIYGFVRCARKGAAHKYYGYRAKYYGNMKIHQLVCEAFHGPKPCPEAVVIHIDENSLNNKPENLRWGTQKENLNMPKIKEYHRSRTGENNPRVKWAQRQSV
jgi:hypothetical protein